MATTDDDWTQEKLAEWRSLAERGTLVGIEQAAREAGCSEQSVVAISALNQVQEIESQMVTARIAKGDRDSAVFFTLVGRGISSVKSLDLERFGLSANEAAALFVNLSTNTNIEKLNLSGSHVLRTVRGCTVLGQALRPNATLQDLHLKSVLMGSECVTRLLDGLKGNTALVSLDLSGNFLRDEGIKSVTEFLTRSPFLKALVMTEVMPDTDRGLQAANYLSSALECNTTLEELHLGGADEKVLGSDIFQRLLMPLSQLSKPNNTTLRRLHVKCAQIYSTDLAMLISVNKTLSTLGLTDMKFSVRDWKDIIFPALKSNETLEELDLQLCKGLDDLHETLMDILRSSSSRLTRINLSRTGLSSWQGRVDEELRMNKAYRLRLRGQATVQTKSGRLVLCGYAFAGKTAISKTMQRIEIGTPWSHTLNMVWKKLAQMFPRLRQCLFGKNACRELATRTRGFDVVTLKKQPYLKYIWDFAGQREYYALHDYLFPDVKNSSFLYVSSCRLPPEAQIRMGAVKSQEIMRAECEFWMKFIASNSKPPPQGGQNREQHLPHVRFVLTNKDTLNPSDLNISRQRAKMVVRELKEVFKDVIEICETVEVVNAHSSEDVERILTLENENLEKVLAHKTEYVVCEEVRKIFDKWSADSEFKPIVTLRTFHTIREGRFSIAETPLEVREALLPYLNDLGEVIYFRGLDLIVVNPRWFGLRVLGSLIDAFKGEKDAGQTYKSGTCDGFGQPLWKPQNFILVHDKGYVDKKDLKDLLKFSLETTHLQLNMSSDKLIDLMIHLELCFKKEPGNVDSSLFLPALFDDETEAAAKGKRKLEWKLVQTGQLHLLGRRLECESKAVTFLTPGFFPRLQVHLRNYFHEKKWTENIGFSVDRNLISIAENGVEVLVEYSGDIDYFIDVLVRSSKPHSEALKFINEHVITKIQQFCASPQGCQGVLLVEAVIRPVCVQDLFLCRDRKFHAVLVTTLEAQIEMDKGYKHTWSHRIDDVSDTDFALDLLEGGSPEFPELPEEFSRQFPKLFYPSIEDVGKLRTLDIRLNLARKMPIKLHLLCDHNGGSHKVEGQPGRTVILNCSKGGGFDLNITKLAVTLLWAGVGLGASVASGGAAVVNLPQVDNWIQSLFNVHEMPDIDAETLQQMMNPGRKTHNPSEHEILRALERYWRADPCTQGLKDILDLKNSAQFWKDFRLRKVVYTEAPAQSKIGWVCDRHFNQGFQQRILRSVPLTDSRI